MAFTDLNDSLWGSLATPDLIGRQEIISRFKEMLANHPRQPKVMFLLAKGGMGKTRLLDKMLRLAAGDSTVRTARGLVDFYHMNTHTPNGLVDALYEVLTPPSEEFHNYKEKRQAFEHNLARGDVSKITEERRREALEAFNQDMSALAAKQPVIIALDTAEKLIHGSFEPGIQTAEAWAWLCDALANWKNVILLVAGRWPSEVLLDDLRKCLAPDQVDKIEVGPFSEMESLHYFDEVYKVATTRSIDTAERIKKLPDDLRRLAHIYSAGEPILLSLLIETLSGDKPIPSLLQGSLEDARNKSQEEVHEGREILESELIARIRETRRIGDTILALGRVPKGIDDVLLARLLGDISIEEARRRLRELDGFSFVKKRPSDERVFLHDEMYALLKRWIYDDPADAPKADKADAAILAYYQDYQIKNSRDEMDALFSSVEAGQRNYLDLDRLTEANTHRSVALTEIVYYRLRQDPASGYKRFYRYVREATLSGDVLLEAQLQSELAAFLAEPDTPQQLADCGISLDLLRWSILLRPVTKAYASQQYSQIPIEAENLWREHSHLLTATAPGSEAILTVWEAYAMTYQPDSDLNVARGKLDRVIDDVEEAIKNASSDALMLWRLKAVLGFAHRIRAYIFRVRGLMGNAVNDYRRAAALFRGINLRIELAATLNDMGYAMAELGNFSDARTIVEDALQLRRQLGPRVPVGLSLSTLSRIDLLEGRYEDAIKHAESALSLFTALGDERRAGLAYTALAEAQRRHSGSIADAGERIRILREAREYARRAIDIFERSGEQYRMVEALIEEGCAYRDWAKVRMNSPSARDDVQRLKSDSELALRKAARAAGETFLYRKIDALVDIGWMGFYTSDDQLIDKTVDEVFENIPEEYKLDRKNGMPSIPRDDAQVLVWTQMGKLHVLLGHSSFRTYYGNETDSSQLERQPRIEALRRAAENYWFGLQYSSIYSRDYHGLRIVKDQIYDRFRRLHEDELKVVAEEVQSLNNDHHLEDSVMEEYLKLRALWYGD
jgi:tetratricopeptide (TPR) repeat protein